MIILDDSLLINQGTVRACYQHPHESNLIIKVPIGNKKDRDEANSIELEGYQTLIQQHKNISCISRCYGLEETNLGLGLICDCVFDADSSVSKSILDLINSDSSLDISYLTKVIKDFTDYLLRENIYIFDLNVKNIVIQQQTDGSYTPIIIDVKGASELKEFIPLSRYIPYFRKRKLARRCRQLLERTELNWQRRTTVSST